MTSPARLRIVLLMLAAVLLPATAAAAHEGHTPLPDGFAAEIVAIQDAQRHDVVLGGVSFAAAPNGTLVTASNTTGDVLEIAGEQAAEPLLRLTADQTLVNERSPQSSGVQGGAIPTEAAADLLDLLYQRVEPSWVAVGTGGSVTFMDHRGALAHVPERGTVDSGAVIGEYTIPITYRGDQYTVHGRVVAVEPSRPGLLPLLGGGFLLVLVLGGGWVAHRRRGSQRSRAAADEDDLVSVR